VVQLFAYSVMLDTNPRWKKMRETIHILNISKTLQPSCCIIEISGHNFTHYAVTSMLKNINFSRDENIGLRNLQQYSLNYSSKRQSHQIFRSVRDMPEQ
jgi:hypothetical protein